jgi:ABC-type multidrug transport system permease subunit
MVLKGLSDSGVITWRNLMSIKRTSDWVLGATVQPAIIVVLFAFVLGSAIGGSSGSGAYREFIVAGAFTQTMVLNSAVTIVGFANDLQKGVIDRFRSLPMSRIAVLLGRAISDLAVGSVRLAAMSLCGLLIGWRIRGSFVDAVLGYLVMLMFSFALSWVAMLIGLISPSVEVAQGAGLIWVLPIVYVSSAYVPAAQLPGILRPIGDWNPLTAVANATRNMFGNHFGPVASTWPAEHATLYAIVSCAGIVAVFAPLAVARYQKAPTR